MSLDRNYINRVYQAPKLEEKEVEAAKERLMDPLPLVESRGNTYVYKVDDSEFTYSVALLDDEDLDNVRDYSKGLVDERGTYHETIDSRNWLKVTEAKFTLEDTELDLFTILPEGYRIYNYTFADYGQSMGTVFLTQKIFLSLGH